MTTSLTLVRKIKAQPATVYEALTQPDLIARWWGPDAGPEVHHARGLDGGVSQHALTQRRAAAWSTTHSVVCTRGSRLRPAHRRSRLSHAE